MVNVLQDLVAGLSRWGDRPAVVAFAGDERTELSYFDLDLKCRRLAAGLIAEGVEPGEPVAIFADNRPAAVVVRLALIAVGAVLVCLDEDLRPEPLAQVLAVSRCRRLFTQADKLPRLEEAGAQDLTTVLLDEGGESSWRGLLADPPAEVRPQPAAGTAALFFTSGTTGQPKGVPLSHANIASNLNALIGLGLVGPGDRVLLPLPLHHAYPFIVGLLTPLAAGAAVILPAEVTGPALRQALTAGQPTVMVGVPRLYEALADGIAGRVAARGRLPAALFRVLLALSIAARRRLGLSLGRRLFAALHRELAPGLQVMASGGARLDPDVGWRLEGLGWQVLTGYGLVETASISTFNPPGRARMASVGRPAPGVEVRLAAPDNEGRGEVEIRGRNVFAGYLEAPEANQAAFTEDGWFKSGDLGRWDQAGYLEIVGRLKEMIVLPDGKNVSPEEVEAVYGASPYLKEVAVLERKGALAGLLVPELDALRAAGSGRVGDLIRVSLAELGQQLAPYQRLADYAITREALPRSQLGKYRRHLLPGLFEAAERGAGPVATAPTEADRALLEAPRVTALWDWLRARFPDHDLSLDSSPQLDLGIDSLAWVSLGLEIEEALGLHLGEATLAQAITFRDLLTAVAGGAEAPAPLDLGAESARWLAPTGPADRRLGRALHLLFRLLAKGYLGLRVEGLSQVPQSGPLIIAANHVSDLDPFVLGAALDFRRLEETYWGADFGRAFTSAWKQRLARVGHLFPVDDRTPGASLALGTAVLARGQMLVWFPEEWRSPDGALQAFLPGVAHLARESGAALLPAYISGTFEAMPRSRRWPRPGRVTVTFGTPVPVAKLEAEGSGDSPEARICEALRRAVGGLKPAGA